MIACVHISNICNTAYVTTARLTITENMVITLCNIGVSFHFVFIVYSAFLLPSLSKVFFSAVSVGKIGAIRTIKAYCIFPIPCLVHFYLAFSFLFSLLIPLSSLNSVDKQEICQYEHNHDVIHSWSVKDHHRNGQCDDQNARGYDLAKQSFFFCHPGQYSKHR